MSYARHDFAVANPYRNGDEVEDRVRRFLPMVRRAAWHIYGTGRDGLEIEDLMQAGVIALTECAWRHAGPGEDGFAAYAKMRVRGAMFDLIRKLMPDTRTMMQRRRRYDDAAEALRTTLGRDPSRAELAHKLGCGEAELVEYATAHTRISSIDDSYDESHPAFQDDTPDPFDMLVEMDNRDRLLDAMQQLPQRLQLVLQLFFVEELNLTEIAEILEVSVPRVHQLRGQALSKLRDMLGHLA